MLAVIRGGTGLALGRASRRQRGEIGCRFRGASLHRAAEGRRRLRGLPALGEQRSEIAGPGGVTASIGAPISGLRVPQVSALLQQDAQIERAVGVAALVPAAVRLLRSGDLIALLQQDP